ncbi:MAG: hypothetical protein JNL74_12485, partial [Fibrobacteres bacterium]|nr:hypothetical protein [Fibrobacterota bacterium]
MKILLSIIVAFSILSAQLPDVQQPLSWIKQHTVNVPNEAVRCYENITPWINPLQQIHLHSGHLGLPLLSTDWSEPLQTNQTWKFSFTSGTGFSPTYPWLRPPKRCGGKGIYDEGANRVLFYGGSHRVKSGYGIINTAGTAVELNAEERNMWAWNPHTEQWYDMRPLPRDLMSMNDYFFRGYTINFGYARDYGLMLFSTTIGLRIQAYSYHFNRYILFGDSGTIPRIDYQSASYDLRKRTLVIAGNDTDTYLFTLGENKMKKADFAGKPSTTFAWYGGTDAVSYDENSSKHIYLRGDGGAMYTLDLNENYGWRALTSTVGTPPSAGHLGTNLHYARELNAHINYSAIGSQIWTFKLAAKDNSIPEG